jgi:glycosyltransferase involved in cell wall biosynthesis
MSEKLMPSNLQDDLWVVVIGRNEGSRLISSLESMARWKDRVIYVDSGSSDGSPTVARDYGAVVVELDPQLPFTAARARNEGALAVLQLAHSPKYIQFVDGDCVLSPGWLHAARTFLDEHDDVAAACGRRRERHPDTSVYNRLCDIEWNTPVGETEACGGDALFRLSAYQQAGGFSADLIAGEEPELCARLRRNGWKIWRINVEMTLHDAAMTHFQQWWKRAVRAGYAEAEIAFRYKRADKSSVEMKRTIRGALWGGALPIAIVLGCVVSPLTLTLSVLYPLQMIRIAAKRGIGDPDSWLYSFFMMVAKFAQFKGALRYARLRVMGKRSRIIEYKKA